MVKVPSPLSFVPVSMVISLASSPFHILSTLNLTVSVSFVTTAPENTAVAFSNAESLSALIFSGVGCESNSQTQPNVSGAESVKRTRAQNIVSFLNLAPPKKDDSPLPAPDLSNIAPLLTERLPTPLTP